ncbi:MAG TPA: hypothetical protein VFJ97_05345 [Dermatophilaceae bacterium]|nr:hypothetical protein [Dermatophilaceae bacterium]
MSRPARVDVVLRLLDHQVVDPDDAPVGNVDDIGLDLHSQGCAVVALCVGVGSLGHRWPGRLGAWTVAGWRRLHPGEDARSGLVPVGEITAITSAVAVTAPAARRLEASFGAENWLREHVIAPIPGSGEDDSRPAYRFESPVLPVSGELVSLGQLLQCQVRDADGRALGGVNDVHADLRWDGDRVGAIVVTDLSFGPRGTGSVLGYNRDRHQGPWLVGKLVRFLHRRELRAPWPDVAEVDLRGRVVRLRPGSRPRHPLDEEAGRR